VTSDTPINILRSDRRAIVVEDRDELRRIDAELDHHQAAELRIAILFDDEDLIMRVDEVSERTAEWKCSDAHRIELTPSSARSSIASSAAYEEVPKKDNARQRRGMRNE
jgi:hypothetical protein